MRPPADPWGTQEPPPDTATPVYWRAAVPVPAAPVEPEETVELALTVPAAAQRSRGVSWQRTSRASRRSLSDGWGLTAAGAMVAFAGWGVWAAPLRGTSSTPLAGLIFMIIVAAGVFGLARFFGYLLLQQVLRRRRPHARWAHLLTGAFLTVAGVSYLVNTTWLADAGDWLRDTIEWIGEQWPRG